MQLKKNTPVVPAAVETTVRVLAFAPSLENYLSTLPSRFPGVLIGQGPSMESQQLDNSAQQAAVDQVLDTLDKYDEDHPHTGSMHVYLLDGQGLSAGDPQGEGTLHALVSAALNDPRRTVAALVPEDASVSKIEDLAPSTLLRQLAETVLSTEGITILVGREALETFLANPPEPSAVPAPTAEGVTSTATMESALLIAGILAGFAVYNYVKDRKGKKKDEAAAAKVDKLVEEVKRTYSDPHWLDGKSLVTGPVAASGILSELHQNGKAPIAPGTAVMADVQAVKHVASVLKPAFMKYAKQIENIEAQMGKLFFNNSDFENNGEAMLKIGLNGVAALKYPHQLVKLPTPTMLAGYTYTPTDAHWNGTGNMQRTAPSQLANTVPALNALQLKSAAKTLTAGMDLIDDLTDGNEWLIVYNEKKIYRFLHDVNETQADKLYHELYAENGYDDEMGESNARPLYYAAYLDKHVKRLLKELQALELWIDRSIQK